MSGKVGKNLNLIVVGAQGRMGEEIRALAKADSTIRISAEVNDEKDWAALDAKNFDLALDFSSPPGLAKALQWCVQHNKPLVSGTTGLTAVEQEELARAAKKIPVLYSANMSLGIAILSKLASELAPLSDWDFQIEEAHHAQKKDKPSGTALLLQRQLTEAIEKEVPTPLSVRGGNLPGRHKIWAMGQDEVLALEHTALNRRVFARGALAAARWLFDKGKPGLYDLSDLYKRSR